MRKNVIIYILVCIWCIVFYYVAHYDIELYFFGKFSGFLYLVYKSMEACPFWAVFTSLLLTSGMIYLVRRKWDDRHFSLSTLLVRLLAIEVLWLVVAGWNTPTMGDFHLSLYHYCAILLVFTCVVDALRYWKNRKTESVAHGDMGFTTDDVVAVQIDAVRKRYADKFLKRLCDTGCKEESCAVVIYGSWGSGKTVFLNYIESQLQSISAEVLLFNPWNSLSPQQVITDFFELLANRIKQYDSSLEKPILRYSELLDIVKVPELISKLPRLFEEQNEGTSVRKQKISEALKNLGMPIYVLIDDLDRMDADEIFAVIRLIRNTANFPCLKFIVACDKCHVEAKLKEKGVRLEYLQKIFMAEIYLPSIYAAFPHVDCCRSEVLAMTSDNHVYNFFETLSDAKASVIEKALANCRQAKRFARSLVLDWEFARENSEGRQLEILFGEYFWMELLKYTLYPFYRELEENPRKYFRIAKNGQLRVSMYILLGKNSKTEETDGLQMLEQVFPKDTSTKVSPRSIALLENYDKYFSFGQFPDRISYSQYAQILRGEGDVLMASIKEMPGRKILSLQHLVQMTDGCHLELDHKKRYLDIYYSLGNRLSQEALTEMINERLLPMLLDEKDKEKVKAYLQAKWNQDISVYAETRMSSLIGNALICQKKMKDYLPADEIKDMMKANFTRYVAHHSCDAADVVKVNAPLHQLVKASVICLPMIDEHGNVVADGMEYECVVFNSILQYFSTHKSHKVQVVKDFETLDISEDMPQEQIADIHASKQEEINALFGDRSNYERFKAECFD